MLTSLLIHESCYSYRPTALSCSLMACISLGAALCQPWATQYVTTHHLAPDLGKGNCAGRTPLLFLAVSNSEPSGHAFEARAILAEVHVTGTQFLVHRFLCRVYIVSCRRMTFTRPQMNKHPAQSKAACFLKGYATMALPDNVMPNILQFTAQLYVASR